jgi:hypothetical protein
VWAGMVIASLLAAACEGPDEDKSEPSIVATQQAFSGNWDYAWFSSGSQGGGINIGNTAGRTCLLSGISGLLALGGDVLIGMNFGNYDFSFQSPGRLGGWARCVSTDAGRTNMVTWRNGQAAKRLAAAAPGRRCFLTEIGTSRASGAAGFTSSSDYIRIWNDGTSWFIGGVQWPGADAWGTGICFDVTSDEGSWLWIAGSSSTRKDPLAYNPGGVNCLLTGVGGAFAASDWNDGAFISYDKGINQFFMNTSNGKRAWATCVK